MILKSRAGLLIFSLLASTATTVAAPRPIVVPPPPSSSADSSIGSDVDGLLAAAPPPQQQQQPQPQQPPPPPLLLRRQQELNNDTLNGLVDGSPCRPLTVVFARLQYSPSLSNGLKILTTHEPVTTPHKNALYFVIERGLEPGNVGSFAGPPFFQALASRVGAVNMSVQGVDYPAVSEGFYSGGDQGGSQTMANLVLQAKQQCPHTKIILSGYSQGGQLVHNAARILGPQGMISAVSAAVTFGDPYNPAPVPGLPSSDTLIFCHNGDDICKGGEQLFDPHFTYNRDAGKAADFVLLITKLTPAGMGPPLGA
ncbi:cutinase [Magnaporthiopsis poae ATCC 64411]|uniref:Cutinase n=1 Tax=Magnaporthiopsis poae (strain ATCC 64411 / 73-15) TaxID=644358 RepID=A0A0C4DM00_MAGP6|nr:cutinase [Magnaporthiopsis poae ATCC 64411]